MYLATLFKVNQETWRFEFESHLQIFSCQQICLKYENKLKRRIGQDILSRKNYMRSSNKSLLLIMCIQHVRLQKGPRLCARVAKKKKEQKRKMWKMPSSSFHLKTFRHERKKEKIHLKFLRNILVQSCSVIYAFWLEIQKFSSHASKFCDHICLYRNITN